MISRTYTDEDANECFFRNASVGIHKADLCVWMERVKDAIPYAKYLTTNGTKEVSTLNEVKKRLGLDTDSEEDVTPTRSRTVRIRPRHRMASDHIANTGTFR